MDELIAKLEALDGPDRNVDAEIYHTIKQGVGCGSTHDAPLFTASIDAAITLLDKHALWAVGNMEDGSFARLCWPQPDGSFLDGYYNATATTPAIALCIAALKAKGDL